MPLKRARQRLFFYFGPVADSGMQIQIAATRDEFLRILGPAFPDWGVGAAIGHRRTVVLLAPHLMPGDPSFSQIGQHEYAHIYLALRAGTRAEVPRWFDEGFAMHTAFEWSLARHIRLARASLLDRLLTLRELEDVNRFGGEKAALAYTQSFAAYQFFEEQFGREGVREFLASLRAGHTADQAFWQALGTGYDDFEANLTLDIARRHNMGSILTDTGLIWALLALFIVVAWLIKKRRARDIERRWRIEDRIHGEPDFNEYVDPDDDESWRS